MFRHFRLFYFHFQESYHILRLLLAGLFVLVARRPEPGLREFVLVVVEAAAVEVAAVEVAAVGVAVEVAVDVAVEIAVEAAVDVAAEIAAEVGFAVNHLASLNLLNHSAIFS